MDYKQSVMSGVEDVFQSMASGATQSPLSRNIVITSLDIYAQKRSKYLQRLTSEKNAFNSSIIEIQKKKAKRVESERQRGIDRQKRKEQAVHYFKLTLFWGLIVFAIAINVYFAKNAIVVPFNYCINIDSLDMDDILIGWWSAIWPAWIAISISLLLTFAIGRKTFQKTQNTVLAAAFEVAALLIYAIVLSCMLPPSDTIMENIIGGLLLCAIGYAVPVVISTMIGVKMCGMSLKKLDLLIHKKGK